MLEGSATCPSLTYPPPPKKKGEKHNFLDKRFCGHLGVSECSSLTQSPPEFEPPPPTPPKFCARFCLSAVHFHGKIQGKRPTNLCRPCHTKWEATDLANGPKKENSKKWLGEGATVLVDPAGKKPLHCCDMGLHRRKRVKHKRLQSEKCNAIGHLQLQKVS